MPPKAVRRLFVPVLVSLGLLTCAVVGDVSVAQAGPPPTLNLETLTGPQAETMLQNGTLTSVQLVQAYMARIAAINKAGPGLNAVTQINPDALTEAAAIDKERAEGMNLGPAMGLPILIKDIIDATPMFTSAGDWALRNSYAPDSGVAKELKAHGLIILGKTGLSEWANSFGSQPSGFSNLTGQVLSAIDTAEGPSGSSSGSGAAASAGLATLTIGTETSGSIISPSTMQADVGLRPTVGLVPGYGIAPIDVSQDTAGPIVRTVSDAAITLQSIAEVPGSDPTASQEYTDLEGPNAFSNGDVPTPPFSQLPNYSSALSAGFVSGKRIGYNGACTGYPGACTGTPTAQQLATDTALNALVAAGAILVPDPTFTAAAESSLPSNYEAHATIDEYYKGIDPLGMTPTNLAQEVALDNTDPQEAEKDGNSVHAGNITSDDSTITSPGSPTALGVYNAAAFQAILPYRKLALQSAITTQLACPGAGTTTNGTTVITLPIAAGAPGGGGATTVDDGSSTCPANPPQGPVIAVIGSTASSSPAAGFPEMVVPMGYTTTQRRNIGVDISGGAYDELNILGVGYAIEQATNLRQPVGMVDPASYRCAHTVPAEPFASRGHCNPDVQSILSMLGGSLTTVPFPLETTSATTLESMMAAKTLTSQQLVKAELSRIALSNADGPSIQAVRDLNPNAVSDAIASDARRTAGTLLGPLDGVPVLVDDSMDISGLPTSAGSIALEDNVPAADSTLVAKLRAAGAIILGDTNTTELGGEMDQSSLMPQGYSSLGGQALLPSDTNKSIGGSSAGSAAAVSEGYAPLAVGMETSTDSAQMIAAAGNAGDVALKPTVGLISRTGVLPVAKSQDSPGPIGQTVTDVATELGILAGPDPTDPATAGAPSPVPNYTAGLSAMALSGKKIAVISTSSSPGNVAPYPAAVTELGTLGATATAVVPGAATTAPSIIPYEFHLGLDSYLAATSGGGPKSLQDVINYNNANAVEGLKFGQSGLTAAEAVNYNDGPTTATYATNLATGKSASQAVINNILTAGPYSAIMVPSGSTLVGIADRAGYPVLTLPAGYGAQNSATGADPIGVDFIGGAFSEAELLDDAYAYEQGTQIRTAGPPFFVGSAEFPGVSGAPSETNQSMWRCVAGSAFFHPYDCNAGDLETPASTTVSVTCPGSIQTGTTGTCTATVSDVVSPAVDGSGITPTGTVGFASTDTGGAFSAPGSSCTLSGTGGSASCSVSYSPSVRGTQTITGTYGADLMHAGNSGTTTLIAYVGPLPTCPRGTVAAPQPNGYPICVR